VAIVTKLKRNKACASAFQTPNPSLNRTRNGMPPSGLISFWPCGVLLSPAG